MLSLLLAAVATSHTTTVVDTANGPVTGLETDTYRSFRGIPFASPPVGDLRWRPPTAATPWAPKALDATDFKHNCMQNPSKSFMGWPQPLSTLSEDW
jgi:carboxylesterase type B